MQYKYEVENWEYFVGIKEKRIERVVQYDLWYMIVILMVSSYEVKS